MNKSYFSMQRFLSIIKKEFIRLKRDPIALRIPFVMPIMLMLLFGYAVNTEVDNIPTAVLDLSKTVESREYIEKFFVSNYFVITEAANSFDEIECLINSNKIRAALIIPSDYAFNLKQSKVTDTELIVDGTDPTTARTALNSGILISEYYSRDLNARFINSKKLINVKLPSIKVNTKVWFNPNLESNKFTIPGLVGLILQNITVMLTAFALVREKERGTIEQLIVTPIRSAELIIGKLIPYIFVGYVGFLFSLGLCVFWFGISVEGSVVLLLILGLLFVLASLAVGILISTFTENQLQAMMGMVIFILPAILLSGFIFPRETMPVIIKSVGFLIPLTYFLNIVRGIVLEGVGVEFLYNDIIALSIFTVIICSMAILRFRKRLD